MTSSTPARGIRIVDFEPRWRDAFAALNIEWLEHWFAVEDYDRAVLGHPEQYILADGGHILFAIDGGERALGTVALKREGEGGAGGGAPQAARRGLLVVSAWAWTLRPSIAAASPGSADGRRRR